MLIVVLICIVPGLCWPLVGLQADDRQEIKQLTAEWETRKQTLGPDHLDTLATLMDLANAYNNFGDYHKALEYDQQVWEGLRRILGPDHPDTLTAMSNLAVSYGNTGDYKQSVAIGQKALETRKRVLGPDHPDTLQSFFNLVSDCDRFGDFQKALEYGQQAWEASQRALGPDHPHTLTALSRLATAYDNLGDYQKAVEYGQQVYKASQRALGPDHPDTLSILNNLAISYGNKSDYKQALAIKKQVLEVRQRTLGPDHPMTLSSLISLAKTYDSLGDFQKALECGRQALETSQRVFGPDHPDTLSALNKLAISFVNKGDHNQALTTKLRIFEVHEHTLGLDHPTTLSSLFQVAITYYDLGDYQKALGLYQQAYEGLLLALGPNHRDTLNCLENMATTYQRLGDYQKALDLSRQVWETEKHINGPNRPRTLGMLSNLATIYSDLGDYQSLLDVNQQVWEGSKQALGPDHPQTLISLNNLAESYRNLGDYQKELELKQQVWEAKKRILDSEHPDMLPYLTSLGSAYNHVGDYRKALELNKQAWETGKRVLGFNHPHTLHALRNLARSHGYLGDLQKAMEYDQQALTGFSQKLGLHHPHTADCANSLAQKLQKSGQLESAIFYTYLAVESAQRQRQSQLAMNEELQKSYLATVERYYQMLAAWLVEAGRPEEALEALRLLKADELSDVNGDKAASGNSEAGPEQGGEGALSDPLHDKLERLGLALSEADSVLEGLSKKENTEGLTTEEIKAKTRTEAELARAQKDFQGFMTQLEAELMKETRSSPYQEAGRRNLAALQDIIQKMGEGTVIIHTLSAEGATHLFVTSKDGLIMRQSPVGLEEMKGKVTALQSLLRSPGLDPRPAAQAVYRAVLEPLKGDLKDAKVLMVSVDGALRYIPLAALYDGEQWLIENYSVVMFTEAARDKLTNQANFEVQAAALGLTEAKDGLSALPAVKDELNDVVKLEGEANGVLPGIRYLNEQFTYQALSACFKEGREILHLASHFVFRPQEPNMSYLLLGDGHKLTIMDISKDAQLPFDKVDMLTLSACETVAGLARGNGREVEGLAALAQSRGAATVLATLWPIADDSTGRLMSDFYRLRFDEKLTKAAALRQAQLNLIEDKGTAAKAASRGKVTVIPVSDLLQEDDTALSVPWTEEPYAHPYFWAPFILMGNWK